MITREQRVPHDAADPSGLGHIVAGGELQPIKLALDVAHAAVLEVKVEDFTDLGRLGFIDGKGPIVGAVALGTKPPIQSPFFLEAAILSRIRSPVTSRSNWAKDSKTFSVSRPIELVVLNCWVTDTNDTLRASNASMILAKSVSDRVSRST